MDGVKELLSKIGKFNEAEIGLFKEKAIERKFQKEEILLKEGEVGKSAFYLISGEAYQFFYQDIDETIIDLHLEKELCLNHTSFTTQKPSAVTIKAYSDIAAYELSMDSVHALIGLSPSFFQLGRVLDQSVARVRYFDHTNTAEERYHHLFATRPQLFQKFPLKMIASYLKVSPETISRIRAKK